MGDAETAAGSLTLIRASSSLALVPTNSIVFGGSGSNRTVTVTPAANQNGTATITVGVSDGQYTTSNNFILTVTAVNDAPTITAIADQTISLNGTAGPLNFTVGDVETVASNLVLSAGSSNPTLVPTNNIVFGGSGAARTVTVTPVTNQTGSATITVTVGDGQLTTGTSFVTTVSALPTGTRSFTNATAISIPDSGASTPYPSTINVSGMGGSVSNVTATLRNLTHTWTSDLDVLLVGPTGQAMVLMSDCGRATANNVTLTFSDAAASVLTTSALVSSTFRPTNLTDGSTGGDNFPSPAPAGPYGATLATLNGTGVNGSWSLYVFDDGAGDLGSVAGGWSLTITTAPTTGGRAANNILVPTVTSVAFLDADHLRITGAGGADVTYTVQASSDLVNWQEIGTTTADGSGAFEFVDAEAANFTARFYRVVLP